MLQFPSQFPLLTPVVRQSLARFPFCTACSFSTCLHTRLFPAGRILLPLNKMSFNTTPQLRSVGERRGQRLAPLQTTFSPSSPVNRPRPSDTNTHGEALHPKHQASKSSLRSLFGRDKTSRKPPQEPKLAEIQESTAAAVTPSDPPLSATFCNTPKTAVSTPTLVTSSSTTTDPSARTIQNNTTPTSARDLGWKPPPLFQAYPQAIKHGTLPAPTLSADSILRVHAAAKGGRQRDEGVLSQQWEGTQEESASKLRKREDREKRHIRSVSETISKTDWTQKIYVVTTSGYILQYSGDGKYDRLPEKMLLLGPKSVAFASDAIPGKHWVLQVSKGAEGDTTTPAVESPQPRPLLARLGFHRSYTRRLTHSFLLVFNDPDELSSWLLTVRAQIEECGGKKYVSERVFDDGMEHQLRPKVSLRQLVKKDPNRFSNSFLQPQYESQFEGDSQCGSTLSRRSSYASNNRHSFISTTQTDVTVPPQASSSNNSSGRFYAGPAGPREAPSSPAVRNNNLASFTAPPRDATHSPVLPNPRKRQSMVYMSTQPPANNPQPENSQPPRAQSTDPLVRSASPPTPNFSVPSFSKRFAAKSGMSQFPPLRLATQDLDRENEDEFDTNAIASFPSPPQSPNRSLSSMSRNDSNDLYGFASRQSSSLRRPLRVSNSQDSLVTTESSARQSHERKAPPIRAPRGSVSTVTSTPRPSQSRPVSIVSSTDDALQELPQSPPQPPLHGQPHQKSEPRPRRDPHRGRTSILYPANNSNVTYSPMPNLSRQKSMPGLTIGPPTIPPPNAPLPKIPSPMIVDPPVASRFASGSGADDAPLSPRLHKSPPPSLSGSLRRKTSNSGSLSSHSRFSLGLRSVSARHVNANPPVDSVNSAFNGCGDGNGYGNANAYGNVYGSGNFI